MNPGNYETFFTAEEVLLQNADPGKTEAIAGGEV